MAADYVSASVPDIELEEILRIKHPSAPRWSPDGKWISWLWCDGGITSLSAAPAEAGPPVRLSSGCASVSSYDWSCDGKIAYSESGNLWLVRPGEEAKPLTAGATDDREPKWSPDSSRLAFSRNGKIAIWDFEKGCLFTPAHQGSIVTALDSKGIRWSPSGKRIAISIVDGDQRDLLVLDTEGRCIWRTHTADQEVAAVWLSDTSLHFSVIDLVHHLREHRICDLESGEQTVLSQERSEKGMKDELVPVLRPGNSGLVYVLTPHNWPHLFYLDLTTRRLNQLTYGECDDTGHAEDFLSFSPCGEYVCYSSNNGVSLNERRLFVTRVNDGRTFRLTHTPGTDSCASWSPCGTKIAFLHAGPYRSADIHVLELDRSDGCKAVSSRQVCHSMPETLTQEKITVPSHVTYPGPGEFTVHADLFLPKGFNPELKYPAIVFIHGGMSRQMRHGWHPMKGYSVFYSFHQYLLHKGYVILSVDYRGSIGYGKEYEEATYMSICDKELGDVVYGARFLEGLGYVDSASIGVYGISYGGFLTLGAMAKYPGVFQMGINIAGIWDWDQYTTWRNKRYPGKPWFGAFSRLGGPKAEHNSQEWFNASPRNFVETLRGPVYNLMGSADEAVDFEQMDTLISDFVKHEKDFAALYYPGESHVFTHRATWKDAFTRMEAAFDRHLKTDPSLRPRAMI